MILPTQDSRKSDQVKYETLNLGEKKVDVEIKSLVLYKRGKFSGSYINEQLAQKAFCAMGPTFVVVLLFLNFF